MRESDLLGHIYTRNAGLPPTVAIPPGDDMGGLWLGSAQEPNRRLLLVAVDQLIEGIHFQRPGEANARSPAPPAQPSPTWERIGRKALTRNLSDVAAMASLPCGALVAAALPPSLGEAEAQRLFEAIAVAAEGFDCPLIGGDIAILPAAGDRLTLSVTVLAEPGEADPDAAARVTPPPVLRRGASAGDGVYVTGVLGGSILGHHLDFQPRIAPARELIRWSDIRCMIDLSDGLVRDLGHLCRAADPPVDVTLDFDAVPIADAAHALAEHQRTPGGPLAHALGDGEDYELCFTARGEVPDTVGGVRVTRIGTVVAGSFDPTRWAHRLGLSPEQVRRWGYEHKGDRDG